MTAQIHVGLPVDTISKLDQIATRYNTSISKVASALLAEALLGADPSSIRLVEEFLLDGRKHQKKQSNTSEESPLGFDKAK